MSQSAAESFHHRASPAAIWTALGAVYLIWGSTYLAIRFTVETSPPFLSAAARFIISGGFLYGWRRTAGDPQPTRREWRNASTIGILLLVGGNGGVVWAAQYIPSSLSALLVATVPLWMLLFDAVRPAGEKPSAKALSGVLLGFCGAALLIGWSTSGATPESFYGVFAVVAASLLWAIGSIYGKILHLPSSPLVTTGIEMLCGGAVQLLVAWMFGEFARFDSSLISTRSTLAWSYLTVVGPIAFVAYAWLLRNAPIPLVATYSYVNPLVAIVLGYFLGKEIITMRILLAAGLIIGSVMLVSAPKTR
ncbi:MAG TPA: EamA family transporter [Candidatus Limnocylindrales bacterium]|nr:EamA family transporter [Candidatus Limnocylindrales bacterium]